MKKKNKLLSICGTRKSSKDTYQIQISYGIFGKAKKILSDKDNYLKGDFFYSEYNDYNGGIGYEKRFRLKHKTVNYVLFEYVNREILSEDNNKIEWTHEFGLKVIQDHKIQTQFLCHNLEKEYELEEISNYFKNIPSSHLEDFDFNLYSLSSD